jgi:hypothetical protein
MLPTITHWCSFGDFKGFHKDFFLEKYFSVIGVKVEIKENVTKLRVKVKPEILKAIISCSESDKM